MSGSSGAPKRLEAVWAQLESEITIVTLPLRLNMENPEWRPNPMLRGFTAKRNISRNFSKVAVWNSHKDARRIDLRIQLAPPSRLMIRIWISRDWPLSRRSGDEFHRFHEFHRWLLVNRGGRRFYGYPPALLASLYPKR